MREPPSTNGLTIVVRRRQLFVGLGTKDSAFQILPWHEPPHPPKLSKELTSISCGIFAVVEGPESTTIWRRIGYKAFRTDMRRALAR